MDNILDTVDRVFRREIGGRFVYVERRHPFSEETVPADSLDPSSKLDGTKPSGGRVSTILSRLDLCGATA